MVVKTAGEKSVKEEGKLRWHQNHQIGLLKRMMQHCPTRALACGLAVLDTESDLRFARDRICSDKRKACKLTNGVQEVAEISQLTITAHG